MPAQLQSNPNLVVNQESLTTFHSKAPAHLLSESFGLVTEIGVQKLYRNVDPKEYLVFEPSWIEILKDLAAVEKAAEVPLVAALLTKFHGTSIFFEKGKFVEQSPNNPSLKFFMPGAIDLIVTTAEEDHAKRTVVALGIYPLVLSKFDHWEHPGNTVVPPGLLHTLGIIEDEDGTTKEESV
jgi:hypothetical protein